MERYTKLALPALLLAAALLLASCGNPGGPAQKEDEGGEEGDDSFGGIAGMDHDQMGHGPGGMASRMLMENGKYSDKRFIDAMVPHHQRAIAMARVALKNARHEEIKELAEHIISAQQAEIEHMTHWRQQCYQEG